MQGSTPTWHQTFSVRLPDMMSYINENTESDKRVGGTEDPVQLCDVVDAENCGS
jgi:hypothetical protein